MRHFEMQGLKLKLAPKTYLSQTKYLQSHPTQKLLLQLPIARDIQHEGRELDIPSKFDLEGILEWNTDGMT